MKKKKKFFCLASASKVPLAPHIALSYYMCNFPNNGDACCVHGGNSKTYCQNQVNLWVTCVTKNDNSVVTWYCVTKNDINLEGKK